MIQSDAAGRLLAEAMDKGAWDWSEMLADLRNQTDTAPDRYAAFWLVARQDWLPGMNRTIRTVMGTDSPPWDYAFANECRAFADLLEQEAADEDRDLTPNPAPMTGRRGRLTKAESEAKRAKLMATVGQYPAMKDDIKKLVKEVGVSDSQIRRWLDEAEQKYRASAAATPTRSPEE